VGSDLQVRIDPNETFRLPGVTTRIDRELAAYNVECLEDPVPKAHPEWYALLRTKCVTPLAIHTHDIKLIMDMARVEAMDYVNVGGTPNQTRAAAAVAEAAGCPVWVQFEGHCLDVAAAFDVHLGAAIPNATMPADILHFLREDCIIHEPLDVQDGEVMVPEGADRGIALDDDKIAAYRIEET
jgi:L-alanine-DL-glutamate epimerase-like enolase superfamily enzyme